jgi:hypothetical protein
MNAHDIAKHPVHLGLGASAVAQPEFSGDLVWYGRYIGRHGSDGK